MQRQRAEMPRFEVIKHHMTKSVIEYKGQPILTTSTKLSNGRDRVTTVYRGREDGQAVAVFTGSRVAFCYHGHPGGEQETSDVLKFTSRKGQYVKDSPPLH